MTTKIIIYSCDTKYKFNSEEEHEEDEFVIDHIGTNHLVMGVLVFSYLEIEKNGQNKRMENEIIEDLSGLVY